MNPVQLNPRQGARRFDIEAVAAEPASGIDWSEVLSIGALQAGVYSVRAGAPDPQGAHEEDELYYVIRGEGTLRAGEEEIPVATGTLVFVPARMEHSFEDVRADLVLLVVLESSRTTFGQHIRLGQT